MHALYVLDSQRPQYHMDRHRQYHIDQHNQRIMIRTCNGLELRDPFAEASASELVESSVLFPSLDSRDELNPRLVSLFFLPSLWSFSFIPQSFGEKSATCTPLTNRCYAAKTWTWFMNPKEDYAKVIFHARESNHENLARHNIYGHIRADYEKIIIGKWFIAGSWKQSIWGAPVAYTDPHQPPPIAHRPSFPRKRAWKHFAIRLLIGITALKFTKPLKA